MTKLSKSLAVAYREKTHLLPRRILRDTNREATRDMDRRMLIKKLVWAVKNKSK